jgi:hypothetical protein
MAGEPTRDGPERVLKLFRDVFEVAAGHRGTLDDRTVEESIRLTTDKLSTVCVECQGFALPAEPPPEPEPEPEPALKVDEKRKFHLLRLASCKLSNLFDTVNNPNPMDRHTAHGLDNYMRRIFTQPVYEHLNTQAGIILKIAGRNDVAILNSVQNNPFYRVFLQNILVRIALSFSKYKEAKDAFITDLNGALPANMGVVGHNEYRIILRALFFDLFLQSKSNLEGALLDYEYGPRTAVILSKVAEQFDRDM